MLDSFWKKQRETGRDRKREGERDRGRERERQMVTGEKWLLERVREIEVVERVRDRGG